MKLIKIWSKLYSKAGGQHFTALHCQTFCSTLPNNNNKRLHGFEGAINSLPNVA